MSQFDKAHVTSY